VHQLIASVVCSLVDVLTVMGRFQGGYVLSTFLQIALLIIQVSLRTSLTRATIAASCLGITSFVIFLIVSHYEHSRSVRASTLMILYLSFSILADAMRARTLWSMPRNNVPTAAVFTAFCVCKLPLLIAERARKTVRSGVRQPTPDEHADIVSQAFLWWLLPLFSLGKKNQTLTSETLPDIEPRLTRPGGVLAEGQEEGESDGGSLGQPSIFHYLFAMRGWLLMSPIPPRLAYTGFIFTQPFLVQRATEYMSESSGPNTYKVGGGLIAAYMIVYVGIAVRNRLLPTCFA
jgi:ATP-binding cassette, subfamily C (CFTR/MRP), member 1